MSLAKKAQNLDGWRIDLNSVSDICDFAVDDNDTDVHVCSDENCLDDDCLKVKEDTVIQVEEGTPLHEEFSFVLPAVPGGDFQDEIEEIIPEVEVVDEDIEVEQDPWKWTVATFLQWLKEKMDGVPRHSGKDSAGIERAIAYLEALDKEISRAVRSDLNNEIAIDAVERAREALHTGKESLQDRHDKIMKTKYPKRKKKADGQDDSMVKEAGKSAHIGDIAVTVPLFISAIARTCINSMVSAGKDIEDCFDKLAKEYDLSNREELELMQLLSDMGYAMRFDRGATRSKEVDYTSTENFDFAANYPA